MAILEAGSPSPQRCNEPRRSQPFGPVLAVIPFEGEPEAVAQAKDTPNGLSGSVWTNDVGRALRVGRRWLGPGAPDGFSEVKNVFIATGG